MTDDLLAAIQAGDGQRCVALLQGLDEAARRGLHPTVAKALEETNSALKNNDAGPSQREKFQRHTVARLAMLGTGTLGELRKLVRWQFTGESALAMLVNRRPVWLAEWAELALEGNVANWAIVRALVRLRLIPTPASDFYILGMIAAPGRHQPPRQLLEQDCALLDDELWRLFTCEGSGELSLAAYDKYVMEKNSWLEMFRAAVEDGTIDRARVLASTLDALARDFAPFRAGWFSRLHEALKPTRAERVAHHDRYLDLLGSRVPATVSFAMKALVEVDKAGSLDVLREVDRLGAAIEARDKGTVERVLSILSKAAGHATGSSEKARIAGVAARALGHESAEVQALALDLVGDRHDLVDPYRAVLAPSVLARLNVMPVEPAAIEVSPSVVAVPHVIPLDDPGSLAELFAAVLENQGPPVDIERVVDGVARMTASGRHTTSLASRAGKILERRDRRQPQKVLAELALAWALGRRSPEPAAEESLADFLIWRMWCLAEQVAQRQIRPLLSLPTWADGRIDPAELARRINLQSPGEREAAADRRSNFHLDLIQARLRAGEAINDSSWETRVTWHTKTWVASGKTYSHHRAIVEVPNAPKPSRFDPRLLSTASFRASLEMKRWCATVCPAWREGWFAAGCHDLAYNLEWWEADWSTRAYLELLVEAHTPVGPRGALLIVLGLGAKEQGLGMLAVDALDASFAGGRLSGADLGRALVEAASSGAIKFVRWSKRLGSAAQVGARQAHAIFQAVEELMESRHGVEASDYSKLVELQLELAHRTGLRLSRAGAIGALKAVATGGKTKRVITELLKL